MNGDRLCLFQNNDLNLQTSYVDLQGFFGKLNSLIYDLDSF